MRLVLPVIIISVILAISRLIMDMIKKEDKKNGLNIDNKYYTIQGTIFNKTLKKREEKEKKEKPEINESLWKKGIIGITAGSAVFGLFGIMTGRDYAGIIIIFVFSAYAYTKRKLYPLIISNIFSILIIITSNIHYSLPLILIFPLQIIFTIIVSSDLKKRSSKK